MSPRTRSPADSTRPCGSAGSSASPPSPSPFCSSAARDSSRPSCGRSSPRPQASTNHQASAASGNVGPVDDPLESLILGVLVPPDDVAADHGCLGAVVAVVGAVEREVAQGGELGLDAVE